MQQPPHKRGLGKVGGLGQVCCEVVQLLLTFRRQAVIKQVAVTTLTGEQTSPRQLPEHLEDHRVIARLETTVKCPEQQLLASRV